MTRYTAEVGKENAAWLAGSPPLDTTTAFAGAFASNRDGTVTFSHATLVALRDLPEEADGFVDGTGVMWIEGTGYPVVPLGGA